MAITKLIREHKVKVTKSRLPMSATEENCPRQLPCWLRSWCVRTLHRLFRDPTLRQSVFFHWTQVFLQLNSAANSICYCFRNRHFRNAMLELLKIKTTWRCWNPPPPLTITKWTQPCSLSQWRQGRITIFVNYTRIRFRCKRNGKDQDSSEVAAVYTYSNINI